MSNSYYVSAFIAGGAFRMKDRTMLIYPSIESGQTGLNFAVNQKAADENLELEKVF